ncbi:MAG: hypothetical protein JWM49_1449 [Microbacteriaceae bacterium]|nr:hypothetical protein [Microbacteriaceae bacterium]
MTTREVVVCGEAGAAELEGAELGEAEPGRGELEGGVGVGEQPVRASAPSVNATTANLRMTMGPLFPSGGELRTRA